VLLDFRFNYNFIVKSQFGPCFGKFELNLILSVSGTVTTLNGVSRVSSWIFYFFF